MLIHVGYPKTGSTWLQRHLLGATAGLLPVAERARVKELLIRPHPLWYEPEALQRCVAPALCRSREEGRVPVLSHELLVGHPVSGGHDSTILAERLRSAFPTARILIVIREQRSMLISLFKEYVANGGPGSLQRYLHPRGGARQPVFDFRYLEFHRLIEHYRSLFAPERVLVLPFEAFVENQLDFCNAILAFAGAKPVSQVSRERTRPACGGVAIAIRSRTNSWVHGDAQNPVARWHLPAVARAAERLDRLLPRSWGRFLDRRLQAVLDLEVGHRYADSNHRTAEIAGLDLARLGYDLGVETLGR